MKPKTKLLAKCRNKAFYKAAALLVLVSLGFLIYSNTLKSPFILDDQPNIQDNHHVRLTELALKDIIAAGFKSPNPNRPIANISFALNYYFHQDSLIGYHCTNIIIHILTGILLYFFVKNTLATPSLRSRYERYGWVPVFAALLWLVHPLQTQSVTYIVQRMTSLVSMFYILSFLLYVKGRLTGREHKKSWPWFAGCIIAGILALGCKETAATLPVFILLYECYFFQDLNIPRLKRYLPYVIGVFIIFGLLGLWFLGSSPLEKILSGYNHRDFTLTERLLTQPRAVIYYISLLAYPHPGRLNLDYDFAISHSFIAPPTTLLCVGAVIGLIGLAFYVAKRERLLSFCILWFFGNLAIESSVFALELVFEHRLYLPSMLVCLAIVALAWRCIKQNWVRVVVLCVVIVLCCGWTYERNSVWKDPLTFWKDCVSKSPEKPRPHTHLGNALREQGKDDEAVSHYRLALRFDSHYAEARTNLGNVLQSQGELDEAIRYHRQAIQDKPNYAVAHNNLGNALQEKGNLDEAISHYRQALRLKPGSAITHNNLAGALLKQNKLDEAIRHYRQAIQLNSQYASAHYNLGMALEAQHKFNDAMSHYRQALQLRPEYAPAHYSLGILLQSQRKLDEAIGHYRHVLRIDPNFAKAPYTCYNLGVALQSKGRPDEAINYYRQALRLKPGYAEAHNNLANALGAQGNLDEAIGHYQQALHFKPDYVNAHINLAIALTSKGRLDEAVKHYREVLRLEPDNEGARQGLEAILHSPS
ncbi:MAG: DUF6056 family protein [Planctomycetota bacterium]